MPDYFESPTVWVLFLGAGIITLILTPLVMRWARSVGAVDQGGYRRVGKGAVPLLGGLAIAAPFIIVCLFGYFAPTEMFRMVRPDIRASFLSLAIGCAGILGLGVIDDIKGLRARTKLAVEVVLALFLCVTGHAMSFIDLPVVGAIDFGPVWGTVFTVVWIVGVTNAFNIIDGIDGLASGIGLIAAVAFSVLAATMEHSIWVALFAVTLAGSLLAFLRFNFPPARIFLGDTGSLFIGFSLAAISLMGSHKSQVVLILSPLLVLGLPILETVISMARRIVRGRPIFAPDAHHTHHRLFRRGLSQRRTVLLLYSVSFLLAFSAILHRLLPTGSRLRPLPYLIYGATILGIAWVAGYIRAPVSPSGLFRRRSRNATLEALSRYAALALNDRAHDVGVGHVLQTVRHQARLVFLEVRGNGGPDVLTAKEDGFDPSSADEAEECIRVTSLDGALLTVRWRFQEGLSEMEREDITAFLARLFESVRVKHLWAQNGFTLIEVLVSVVILAVGIVAVLNGFETSLRALRDSRDTLVSVTEVKEKMGETEIAALTRGEEGLSEMDRSFEAPDGLSGEMRVEEAQVPEGSATNVHLSEITVAISDDEGPFCSAATFVRVTSDASGQ